jgi:xanthine dehydrogenase small subunit
VNPRTCLVNDRLVTLTDLDTGLALHWLRATRRLTGVKEGCGEGECGACTVLLGERDAAGVVRYRAVASCLLPVAELAGRHVVTVEGLNPPDGLTPVQQALVDAGAPQCGFCFPGIVMSLTGFLLTADDITPHEAAVALDGNICRCTGYASIRRATEALCGEGDLRLTGDDRVTQLVDWGVLPAWFASVGETLAGLAAPGPGDGDVVMGGGTDLLVQRPDVADGAAVTWLSRRPDLAGVTRDGGWLRLGGGVTIETLRRHADVQAAAPGTAAIIERFASTIIRHRATVAGNLVNASPIGDVSVLLLALGAELDLAMGDRRRVLPLDQLYLGYKELALQQGEIIEAVRVPEAAGRVVSFEKISQRHILDIASVNSALTARLDGGVLREVRLAVGGVAPVPLLATGAAAALEGRAPDAAVFAHAARALDGEIAPIDDVRGAAAYKRDLARRALAAHLLRAVPGCLDPEVVA